ncbi:FG-GAP repeat domain-containing protein [Streptomyces solincola]|uniref:FG-GAP repeat domain-containing protein n=1 Tax=Streptomyces solincola TaxID=2100817 RepID=UPI002159A355|nr:VCBS repeat-containing protein [Streptomyces solincola]
MVAAVLVGGVLGTAPLAMAAPVTTDQSAADAPVEPKAAPGSEVSALEQAAETGEPVEVAEARSETSETYALPNGNLRTTQHSMPFRVKREGVWTPVDTDLAAVNGRIAPKAAAGDVTFSAGGTTPLVTLTDQGRTLSLSWPKPLPQPVLAGATATYREVLPGVDLAVAAGVDGFSQALIVKTPEAAANPELATVDFGLKTDGLTVTEDPATGSLRALNPVGQSVFATSTARMWDSSGQEPAPTVQTGRAAAKPQARTAKSASPVAASTATSSDLAPGANSATVDVTVSPGKLSLKPDQELLTAPDTTYPVYIDPRMTGARQAWTIAYKPHPNDSYWNGTGWSGGTTGEARVGYESSSGGTARSFFRVDSKFLAGVKVVDAQFQITETHSWSCTAKPVELYLTGGISSATTWNKQPSWSTRQDSKPYAHGNEAFGCPDKAVDFEANDAAKKAAAGKWSTITFGLRAPQSAEDGKDEYSWKKFKPDAKLIVEFNRVGKAPWALDTSPSTKTAANDCGNGSTYVTVGNTDVRLQAQVWDPDGGKVKVQFHLWATGKHDVSPGIILDQKVERTVSATDSKGVLAWVDVPKALLDKHKGVSGGQFSWKAQVEDPLDANFASDWTPTSGAPGCRFGFDPSAPAHQPTVVSKNNRYPENTDGALARTDEVFVLDSADPDVVEYKWDLDRTPPSKSVPAAGKGGPAEITAQPLTPGPHTLYVQAFDAGKNASPVRAYRFTATSTGIVDKPGDVNGDGQPDLLTVDGTSALRLYSGTGSGAVATGVPLGSKPDWSGALLTHRGTMNEDPYEDLVARKSDGKLWLYPNDGLGEFTDATKQEMYVFPDNETGESIDPAAIRQIVSVGDITADVEENHQSDFVAVIGDRLWFLPGFANGAVYSGYPIGTSGWTNMHLASPGDLDGDGNVDLIARNAANGEVWVYKGRSNGDADGDGVPDGGTDPSSLGAGSSRVAYATGWTPAVRPLITAGGDSDGDGISDMWTTTANTSAGLEFLPGRRTGLIGAPKVVGTGGWQPFKAIS